MPFGAVVTIILVVAWVSAVSAQTNFGVQRLSNGPRPASPTAFPVAPSNAMRPTGSETAAFPAPSVAAPTGKVAGPVGLDNLLPRKEKETPQIPSVVRLIAFEKNGQSFGSGSYIGNSGEYGLILSNWHVVNDCDGLVHVHFPNGFSSFGAVIDADKKWDLATIVISKPPSSIVPLPIARTIPVPGEPLWIAGHGPGVYRLAGGRCVRYLAPEMPQNGTNPIYEIVELSVSARQGDSGGPILNQNGELAGVLFGSDMVRNTAGSYCGRVSQFLLRATPMLNRLPARPEVYFASIEKEGPKRQLRETINIVPAEAVASVAAPSVVDIAGSSSSSFGVRSNSRRYVQSGAPASVSTNEKMPVFQVPPSNAPSPSSSPTAPSPSTNPSPQPDVPPPATGPIQKAIWTPPTSPVYGSLPATLPPSSFERHVIQTGLNTVVAAEAVSGDPFAEDRSALNPTDDSEASYRIIRENIRQADYSKKYAGSARSPYTLQPVPRKASGSGTILWIGGFLVVGGLVFLAIRLIRADAESTDAEEEAVETPVDQKTRQRAA